MPLRFPFPLLARQWRSLLAAGLLLAAACTTAQAAAPHLTVLGYHEIADKDQALVPGYTVTPTEFAQQMAWLHEHGYHFVSAQAVRDDAAGRKPLPDKAVLLSFDDGYRSVYTQAFPILQQYHAPALVAVVGAWLEPRSGRVNFDGRELPRTDMLSWAELKTMVDSGLVEVGNHTYAMHEGVPGNPQGNREPAATTREWLPAQHRYESEDRYRHRVAADLARNNALLKAKLGAAPRVIVWPYGHYNDEARKIATRLGMPMGLTLDDGPNTKQTPLSMLRRELVMPRMGALGLERELALRDHDVLDDGRPQKVMHVDLDYIYDPDPAQQEKNLGLLLDRIVAMGVNTVYLQAFADPDANGAADAVYFPNRHLPMRADLFNRAAWQISTRTQVKRVYAWMPMLAWQLPASDPAAKDTVVTQANPAQGDHLSMGYPRLSPFSPRVRREIREIYQDLGRAATFDGILFHDDVTLSDYEDASPWALQTYRKWGLPQPLAELRGNDELLRRWAARKTAYLDDFATELAAAARAEEPGLLTARNLYAQVALNPYAETWYSQSLDSSLKHYDYTAIMAMPYMEQAPDAPAFLRKIVDEVAQRPGAMRKVVMELQSVDWRKDDAPLPPNELADTIRMLYGWGVQNVGYYPDNMFRNNPDPAQLRPVFDSKPEIPPLSDVIPVAKP